MAVNRFNIKASTKDKSITIPIAQNFDEIGNEQLVRTWEEVELQDNINVIQDYETTRYAFKNNDAGNTISYEFNFWDYTNSQYPFPTPNFNVLGYLNKDLAKPKKAFTRSFFKFDFYDSPLRKEQKIMFTNIMNLNNCMRILTDVDPTEDPIEYYSQIAKNITQPRYGVYVPLCVLGPLHGRSENYYIQWLKDRELTEINEFYMTCKFFNAKTGKVINMINQQPTLNQITSGEILSYPEWFYYKVKLYIDTSNASTIGPKYRYVVTEFNETIMAMGGGSARGNGLPGGTPSDAIPGTLQVPNAQPIRFYEYVNP
tara:strand:+ start:467 stop:1408 length:942 start_codon:yes stop_codon:yes gene_type:complete